MQVDSYTNIQNEGRNVVVRAFTDGWPTMIRQ